MDLLIGQTIDRYRVVELLGEGAFGKVYRASHQVLHRDVALKVLSTSFSSDRSFAIRFRREAEMASRVQHEHVVQVIDFGATSDGDSFLVMELVHGGTLADLLKYGPLDSARAAQLLKQLAHGLAAIHAHSLVHRDLKPSNIIVTVDGDRETAKIMDFGIARATESEGEGGVRENLTQTGYLLGTPLYMAPEQAYSSRVDAKADMYALGVIAYEMLTGHPPFVGDPTQVLLQRIAHSPPPLETSSGLDALVMALLAREPERRPDARTVIAELESLATSTPTTHEPPTSHAYADDVQFTVYRPKMIEPEKWYALLAFAHLGEARSDDAPDPIEEMKRQAEQVLGASANDYRSSSQDSRLPIPAEGELTFLPDVPGVQFNPKRRSFVWLEDVHREEFRIKAAPHLAGRVARGRLVVMLGHVMIAEVPIALRVEGSIAREEQESVSARTFRRIYACHAPEDREIAAQIGRYAQVLGDRLVSSGLEAISKADVFQLFWSSRAMASATVHVELAHAMALGRADFIRPIHWEDPIPRDVSRDLPPSELMTCPWTRISTSTETGADATIEDSGFEPTIARTRAVIGASSVEVEAPRTRSTRIAAVIASVTSVAVAVVLSAGVLLRWAMDRAYPARTVTMTTSGRGDPSARSLAITSSPNGAMIYLDGALIGSTPADLSDLDADRRYELVIAAPGHAPAIGWIVGGQHSGAFARTLEQRSGDETSFVERARIEMLDQLERRAHVLLNRSNNHNTEVGRVLMSIAVLRAKPNPDTLSANLYELDTTLRYIEH